MSDWENKERTEEKEWQESVLEMEELDELDELEGMEPSGEGVFETAEDGTLYEHRRVVADAGQKPLRVDKFLMDHLRGATRNRIPVSYTHLRAHET